MRFLIDECLTVDLVTVAALSGYDAQHVARIGRAGWKDWNVARHAQQGDFVFVTNNVTGFRRLYARQPFHAGLIIIVPRVGRIEQKLIFQDALIELASFGEPINRVREVDMDGDEVTFRIYDLPSHSP
jgi:predicted nuclease of predicted toxin-antitoxin system